MRLLCLAVVAAAQLAPAQQPHRADALTAARARMEKALQKTAALDDTAFAARWGPEPKPKKGGQLALVPDTQRSGVTRGSWHQEVHHLRFDGDEGDELLLAGRHMIARSAADEWALRNGRFADGTKVPFVPDVELLLQQLANWKLAITNREVGSLDDKPVEIISITLSQDQVAEATWGGMLPPSLTDGMAAGVFFFAAGGAGRGGGRTGAPKPDATVDLAIMLDPATSLIHRLQFRSYANQGAGQFGGGQLRIQRLGRNVAEEEEEEEEEAEPDADAPLQYEDGLPKRSRKKKSVTGFTVRLTQHGQAVAPPLTAAHKKLLQL